MMDERKRYQIFVSSTFVDLEDERGKVMETILNFDCFPAGMELFPAMDEEQFEYIKKIIDDSDYYLLIIGGRYGSVDDGGVSWTEREYDYAISKGIHVMVFDHKNFTELPANKTDQDNKKRTKLVDFKKKVSKGRLIGKWTNLDDLALAVAKSLPKVLEQHPGKGWVRADSVVNGESQVEIDRLKMEIAKHQNEVKSLEKNLKKKDEDYQALSFLYQGAQEEVKSLYEQINNLNTEQKKLKKIYRVTEETKSQAQTEVITIPGSDVSFKMVHVEGGTFTMGANNDDEDAYSDERPAHEVTLSDYWIGETQVTQALWEEVMGENPSRFKDDPNLPVEMVSWVDCKEFIRKLNKLTGKKFHLPTEAQWEFAARGGNLGKDNHYRFAGSYDVYDVAWFTENSKGKTHPVGEMDPNELGLLDMSGNMCEWCQDWYNEYSSDAQTDPTGPTSGFSRVHRGGGWFLNARACRVSRRNSNTPSSVYNFLGLRLAL